MMKSGMPLFILSIVLVLSACRKRDSPPQPELLSFELQSDINQPYLEKDIKANIDGSVIELAVPDTVDISRLIATFYFRGEAMYVGVMQQESGITSQDFTKSLTYVVQMANGNEKSYTVKVYKLTSRLKSVLPHIYVDTDNGDSIKSKKDYIQADIRINGKGQYKDYEGRTKIRGRGNTSWTFAKKPYKLKLMEKAALLGLYPHKKWILLANYLDGSLLINSAPYTMARMLGIPYTNHIIPVELTVNGDYRGVYVFTEHKEVTSHRIDIGTDGLLLELDTYYNEPYEFHSAEFQLPVMIKYPKLADWSKRDAKREKQKIMNEFNAFDRLVADPTFPNNDYLDYFDDTSYVNYMIVYLLMDNEELNRPKSTYINKKKGGKYRMGIIWDFDFSFGYQSGYKHFATRTTNRPFFWVNKDPVMSGTVFFKRFLEDPHMTALLKKRWNWFKKDKSKLIQYIKNYAELIRGVYDKDHARWGLRDSKGDLDVDLKRMLDWLNARINYLDGYISGL